MDAELIKAEREQVERKSWILHRLVDNAVFFAYSLSCPQGNMLGWKAGSHSNEGNFLDLLKLLAYYSNIPDAIQSFQC